MKFVFNQFNALTTCLFIALQPIVLSLITFLFSQTYFVEEVLMHDEAAHIAGYLIALVLVVLSLGLNYVLLKQLTMQSKYSSLGLCNSDLPIMILSKKLKLIYFNTNLIEFFNLDANRNYFHKNLLIEKLEEKFLIAKKLKPKLKNWHSKSSTFNENIILNNGKIINFKAYPIKGNNDFFGLFCVFQDVSSQPDLITSQLSEEFEQLPSSFKLIQRINQLVDISKKEEAYLAVVLLSLDKYHTLKDNLGHANIYSLFDQIKVIMTANLAAEDLYLRLFNDEAIIVLNNKKRQESVMAKLLELQELFENPIHMNGINIKISFSLGLAFYPNDSVDAYDLLKKSAAALNQAKLMGGNQIAIFSKEINDKMLRQFDIEQALHMAIDNDEFELYYQPILNLHTNVIIGVEALIRWNSPKFGRLMPLDFITIAEESDFIIDVGAWVIKEASTQFKLWTEAGIKISKMSVNVSSKQFKKQNIIKVVVNTLKDLKLKSNFLELELTEGVVVENSDYIISSLTKLKELGICINIDDFGTGYSALSYLKQFPVNKLKIDKSFVRDLPHSADSCSIVVAIINLAKSLNLQILAEGVETQEQADFLKKNGCDEIQGYLFSKPIDAASCGILLAKHNKDH